MESNAVGKIFPMLATILIVADQLLLVYLWPRLRSLYSDHCSLSETELWRTFAVAVVYCAVLAVVILLPVVEFLIG